MRHAFFAQDFIQGPHLQVIPKIHQAPRERARIFKEKTIGIIPGFGDLFFGEAMNW